MGRFPQENAENREFLPPEAAGGYPGGRGWPGRRKRSAAAPTANSDRRRAGRALGGDEVREVSGPGSQDPAVIRRDSEEVGKRGTVTGRYGGS